MKAQVYREMSTDELEGKVQELQRHVFDLHSQATTEKLQDCRAAINARRDIARIKTVLRQRQIEAKPAVKAGGKE
ncbi:MAG: 50S ribosomal protein L29 [Sedimentisphaerales bacterium]|jgi:large subunit ribosomal protein L29